MRTTLVALALLLVTVLFSACAPEVGSKAWCENIAEKPKGDWTANEAKEYAKYCVMKNYTDEDD